MDKERIVTRDRLDWRERYGNPPSLPATNIVINGIGRPNSIADAIRTRMERAGSMLTNYEGDVRLQPQFNFQPFDALVMCHGIVNFDWFEDADFNAMAEVIDVNLTGSIRLASAFVHQTIGTSKRKKIVSIGSMAYNHVLNGSAAYCASKAGLAHFMKCLAFELAPKGFDVYSIHPSNVEGTSMTNDTIEGLMRYRSMSRDEAERYWNTGNQRDENLTRFEIAETVAMLLSGRHPFLSGSNIELTGGNR